MCKKFILLFDANLGTFVYNKSVLFVFVDNKMQTGNKLQSIKNCFMFTSLASVNYFISWAI